MRVSSRVTAFPTLLFLLLFQMAIAAPLPTYTQCLKLSQPVQRALCHRVLTSLGVSEQQLLIRQQKKDGSLQYLTRDQAGMVVISKPHTKSETTLRVHVENLFENQPKVIRISHWPKSGQAKATVHSIPVTDEDYTLLDIRLAGLKNHTLILSFSENDSANIRIPRAITANSNATSIPTTSTPPDQDGRDYTPVGYAMLPLSQLAGWTFWGMHAYSYYYAKEEALIGCYSVASYLFTWTFSFWVELAVYQCRKGSELPGIFSQ